MLVSSHLITFNVIELTLANIAVIKPNGYPERYYVVPVQYFVVPTFFWVLWVLCIVPMGTVGYYRAAGTV